MASCPFIILAPLALAAVLSAACDGGEAATPSSTPTPTVTADATGAPTEPGRIAAVGGIVTYLEKIALPPEAVITVQLLDVSLQDAPSVTLSEQTFQADGQQVPFEYFLQYNPNDIDPRGTYSIHAEIWVGSELWFTTDTHVPAITGDAAANPEVVLVRVMPQ